MALAIRRGETPQKEITLGSRVFTAANVESGGEPIGE